MSRFGSLRAVTIVLCLTLTVGLSTAGSDSTAQLRERVRRRIEASASGYPLAVGGEGIYASVALPLFYERRGYRPAWVDQQGPLPPVKKLIAAISDGARHGLRPRDYHLDRLLALSKELDSRGSRNRSPDNGKLVDLELLCSDAFLIYGSHLVSGRVNPETIDAEWIANRREADLAAVMESAISKRSMRL